jgi:hypothetical protein
MLLIIIMDVLNSLFVKASDEGVDTGPTGFRNNTSMSRGPWPGPRAETRRDVASTTPNPI